MAGLQQALLKLQFLFFKVVQKLMENNMIILAMQSILDFDRILHSCYNELVFYSMSDRQMEKI